MESPIVFPNDSLEITRDLHERQLIDLAFEWNYINGAIPILQRWQDEKLNKRLKIIKVN